MKKEKAVDVLNADFVDAYIERFKPSHKVTMWGAMKCKDLSKTLAVGYQMGFFDRWACGLPAGNWQPGFPKWVYSYELKQK